MRLTDLSPEWLKVETPTRFTIVDSIEKADGIYFLCPKCWAANGGPVGVHGVICWRPHVPNPPTPGPGRWEFQGTGFTDLTLVAGSSSVLLVGGCAAHFFIRSGEIAMS
jgi:hypothetical protein